MWWYVGCHLLCHIPPPNEILDGRKCFFARSKDQNLGPWRCQPTSTKSKLRISASKAAWHSILGKGKEEPVSIGGGCNIKNSIIGPNVTIGENSIIDSSILKDSIIGSFSNLYDIVLDDSVIGSDTNLRGESRSLNIGDNTSIDLG